jgi:hypothetical protein
MAWFTDNILKSAVVLALQACSVFSFILIQLEGKYRFGIPDLLFPILLKVTYFGVPIAFAAPLLALLVSRKPQDRFWKRAAWISIMLSVFPLGVVWVIWIYGILTLTIS